MRRGLVALFDAGRRLPLRSRRGCLPVAAARTRTTRSCSWPARQVRRGTQAGASLPPPQNRAKHRAVFDRGVSVARMCMSKFSGIFCAAKNALIEQLVDLAAQLSIAAPRDERRAIREAVRAPRCSMFSPASASTPISMPPANLLTQNAERHLKSDARNAANFSRSIRTRSKTPARLAERLEFSLENIGYEFPRFPVPDGHNMDSFLRTITWFGAQQRYAAISTAVKRQLEEELALIQQARVLRLFSDCLGHRQFLPRAQRHGAGPRQRGEQRGLLLPRDHAGRSGEQSIWSSSAF